MRKYNLTFWQRIELIFVFFLWITIPEEKRRTWHEVKKGAEKHDHNFTIPIAEINYWFLGCDHEGCNYCKPSWENNDLKIF